MADRYWVGGSGTWSNTATTNWSTTSGGSGGASVPTSADNVIIDSNSGTPGTITFGNNIVAKNCLNFTVSASGWAFNATNLYVLNVYGSLSFATSTTWSNGASYSIIFVATSTGKTVTTNGCSFSSNIRFNSTSGGWTLGSSLTTARNVYVTAGSFDTSGSNYSVSCLNFVSQGSSTRTVTLNGSTVTCSAGFYSDGTNITLSSGTSSIYLTGSSAVLSAGTSQTLYDVYYTDTSSLYASASFTATTAVNLHNLTISSPSITYVKPLVFSKNIYYYMNTFTVTGGAPTNRVWITNETDPTSSSVTYVSSASVSFGNDVDFQSIYNVNSAWTGSRFGNRGGNSGITFSTKTVYYVKAAGGNYTDNAWATSSGGSVNINNFPLAQDTVVVDNNSMSAGNTLTLDGLNFAIGDFGSYTRTSAMNLNFAQSINAPNYLYTQMALYPSLVTYTGTGYLNCRNANIVSDPAQKFPPTIKINGYLTVGYAGYDFYGAAINLQYGSFLSLGNNISVDSISSTTTNTRTIDLSNCPVLTVSGSAGLDLNSTNLTFTPSTNLINFTSTTGYINANGVTFYDVNFVAANGWDITGGSTFNSFVANPARNIAFTNDGTTTITKKFIVRGTSVNRVQITTGSYPSTFTLSSASAAVSCNYADISYSTATGGTRWYAGNSSIDYGNNTGWIFADAPSGNMMMFLKRR